MLLSFEFLSLEIYSWMRVNYLVLFDLHYLEHFP